MCFKHNTEANRKVFIAWIVTDHLLMIRVVSFHTTVTVPTGVKSTVYVRVHINQIFMTDFFFLTVMETFHVCPSF